MDNKKSPAVLYYSNRCNFCKKILAKLQQLPKESIQDLKIVCIDQLAQLPRFLNSVPTIDHEGKQMTGKDVFQFIYDCYIADLGVVPFGSENFSFLGGSEGGLSDQFSTLGCKNSSEGISDKDMNKFETNAKTRTFEDIQAERER
tara:strand:- start:586 stop:1020 length:435 start_codon:yes stop_codon:yes gene_type:complete